jgi:opacity protein-like surface antigen
MKKLLTIAILSVLLLSFSVTAFADTVPAKKTQIDWLISGEGGDDSGRIEGGTGEYSYNFTSEDGSVTGAVSVGRGGITIFGCDEAIALAEHFKVHFATLTRTGHFHSRHRLSASSTEEFPIYPGSDKFMTFCYDEDGWMNAMIFEHTVKFVSDLGNYTFGHDRINDFIPEDAECELDPDNVQSQEDNTEKPAPPTGIAGTAMLIPALLTGAAAMLINRKEKE